MNPGEDVVAIQPPLTGPQWAAIERWVEDEIRNAYYAGWSRGIATAEDTR